MSSTKAPHVGDLKRLVKEGEERLFERQLEPTGSEPDFYRVGTNGGYLNFAIRWENRPPIDARPRPNGRQGLPGISLSAMEDVCLTTNGCREQLSDYYKLGGCIRLVSDRMLGFLEANGLNGFELRSVKLMFGDGSVGSEYSMLMPEQVFDWIDVAKSNVRAYHKPPSILTVVTFPDGYVLREDIPNEVACFMEEYSCDWLWRREVFEQAAAMGIRGITGSPTFPAMAMPKIRM